MAQATPIQLTGVLTARPADPSFGSCSLLELLPLTFCASYSSAKSGAPSIASTDVAPFTVPLEGITKVRMFALRVRSGIGLKVLLTTALGVAAFPVSDEYLFHNPTVGSEATQIQLVGTGDVLYALAGDLS